MNRAQAFPYLRVQGQASVTECGEPDAMWDEAYHTHEAVLAKNQEPSEVLRPNSNLEVIQETEYQARWYHEKATW